MADEISTSVRIAYSLQELASALGVSAEAIREWVLRRKVNAIRVGRQWRIPATEYERIIQEGVDFGGVHFREAGDALPAPRQTRKKRPVLEEDKEPKVEDKKPAQAPTSKLQRKPSRAPVKTAISARANIAKPTVQSMTKE